MSEYDIVYIKGNPNSGLMAQHEQIDKTILKLIELYSYKIIESSNSNKNHINQIPRAKVYIGFSRGSRYLKKLNKNSLKLSIGGISGSGINVFTNTDDKVLSGDISPDSMQAHFIILEEDKIKINLLISEFMHNN